ncbi:ABC transporter ATP-binding protein [Treponema parvum]|uniref:ABC transporter ATP-binding protein n=1 Tax=Treponema parvum TaxID=138851 RepID=A0A975F2J0_9SPIR|nr:ABC transporter ATP-binding protein [Treponema parvum]QTQ13361.1 ABC transporter ATP-binding protein [Treponema parvum]
MKTVLSVKNLCVSYGGVNALQDVSLDIEAGAIVALIGANGAGKTSLLNAISSTIPVKSGAITFQGEDITGKKSHIIANKGLVQVPEGRKIFATLSVENNIRVGAYNRYNDKAFVKEKIDMCYQLFPILKERRNQLGGTLSGGEQQMLAIARGLASDPSVLLLDEPSLGIAPIVVEKIFEFIVEINKLGKTIFLVEQNANLALNVSSYAFVLETGKIINRNSSKTLLADDSIKKAYLGL